MDFAAHNGSVSCGHVGHERSSSWAKPCSHIMVILGRIKTGRQVNVGGAGTGTTDPQSRPWFSVYRPPAAIERLSCSSDRDEDGHRPAARVVANPPPVQRIRRAHRTLLQLERPTWHACPCPPLGLLSSSFRPAHVCVSAYVISNGIALPKCGGSTGVLVGHATNSWAERPRRIGGRFVIT